MTSCRTRTGTGVHRRSGVHYAREESGDGHPHLGGNTKRQLAIMRDFKSTILACTPSYSLYLAERRGRASTPRRQAEGRILGAEPWSESMRAEIQQQWGTGHRHLRLTEIIARGGDGCERQAVCTSTRITSTARSSSGDRPGAAPTARRESS